MPDQGSINRSEEEHLAGTCCQRFQLSNRLVVFVNFVSMVAGIMVVSVLQPILPDLLDVMYRNEYLPSPTPDGMSTPAPNNVTFPNKPFIIGSLLGFAPLVEIFFAPIAVIVIRYFGFKKPIVAACLLQLFGCYAIAYANSLSLLYAARITQAISVIFATIAGFSMIAVRFKDDYERSEALATTMHGFPIGILVAYPCGTAIYSYFGIAMPFIFISILSVIATILVMIMKETDDDRQAYQKDGHAASFSKLLTNKAIILSLFLVAYSWSVVFMLGATTPNRMSTLLKAESWQIGIVLFVSTLIQVITSSVIGKLAGKISSWAVTFTGNLICVVGLIVYPWCPSIYYTIGPETVVRVGWGFVTSSLGPFLGTLVNEGHGSAYIRVYALFMSFNLFGSFAGSILGGLFEGLVGFTTLYYGYGVLTFLVAILGYALSCCMPQRNHEELVESTVNDVMNEYSPLLDSGSGSFSRRRNRSFNASYQTGVA